MITYEDFSQVEMRAGTVVEAVIPEGSVSVIRLKVDFGGEMGTKTIFSGIKKWYSPEDLMGKQFIFVVNLPPKRMGNLGESEGMIMAAVPEGDESQPVLLIPVSLVADGARVR